MDAAEINMVQKKIKERKFDLPHYFDSHTHTRLKNKLNHKIKQCDFDIYLPFVIYLKIFNIYNLIICWFEICMLHGMGIGTLIHIAITQAN